MVRLGEYAPLPRGQEGHTTLIDEARLHESLEGELLDVDGYSALATCMKGEGSAAALYKRLARVESEHAHIFTDLMKRRDIDATAELSEREAPPSARGHMTRGMIMAGIAAMKERETRAMRKYAQFAQDTHDPELEVVWQALSEVEGGHAELLPI